MMQKNEKLQLAKEVLLHMYQIADHYRCLCGQQEVRINELERALEEKDYVIKSLSVKNDGIEKLLGTIENDRDKKIKQYEDILADRNEIIDKYLKCLSNDQGKLGNISQQVSRLIRDHHSEAMEKMRQLLEEILKREEEDQAPEDGKTEKGKAESERYKLKKSQTDQESINMDEEPDKKYMHWSPE